MAVTTTGIETSGGCCLNDLPILRDEASDWGLFFLLLFSTLCIISFFCFKHDPPPPELDGVSVPASVRMAPPGPPKAVGPQSQPGLPKRGLMLHWEWLLNIDSMSHPNVHSATPRSAPSQKSIMDNVNVVGCSKYSKGKLYSVKLISYILPSVKLISISYTLNTILLLY